MIRLGRQVEIDDYFESKDTNQSYLKTLLKGVEYLKKDEKTLFYEEKGHFIIGSGVDMKLTQGQDAYENAYHTFEGKKPSDAIMSIVQYVFSLVTTNEEIPDFGLSSCENLILEACEYHNYNAKWNPATKIDKIITEGSLYFEELKLAFNKQVISSLESTLISNIDMSFKTSQFTNKYFKDGKDIDIFYQVPIYFEYMGVRCKVLLDMLVVNHAKKLVQPIDIKTIGDSIKTFPYNFRRRGYGIQGSFYTAGLIELINGKATTPIKELLYLQDYFILPFKFLVETTTYQENKLTGEIQYNQGTPLAFTMSARQVLIGKAGLPAIFLDALSEEGEELGSWEVPRYEKVDGFEDALKLHIWHVENGFKFDKGVIQTDGDILIV